MHLSPTTPGVALLGVCMDTSYASHNTQHAMMGRQAAAVMLRRCRNDQCFRSARVDLTDRLGGAVLSALVHFVALVATAAFVITAARGISCVMGCVRAAGGFTSEAEPG